MNKLFQKLSFFIISSSLFAQEAAAPVAEAPEKSGGLTSMQMILIVAFVLIFLFVISLFAWLVISMSRKEQKYQEMMQGMFMKGQEKAKEEMQNIVYTLEDELERLKQSMPQMSMEAVDEITDLITNNSGTSQVMFIHMGGQRDGLPEKLLTHDPVTGKARKVLIGKNADSSDIALPWDTTVSHRHCEVSFDLVKGGAEKFYIYDLNSRNGVFLLAKANHEFIKIDGKQYLKDGDVIKIGNSQFRIVITVPVELKSDRNENTHVSAFK